MGPLSKYIEIFYLKKRFGKIFKLNAFELKISERKYEATKNIY